MFRHLSITTSILGKKNSYATVSHFVNCCDDSVPAKCQNKRWMRKEKDKHGKRSGYEIRVKWNGFYLEKIDVIEQTKRKKNNRDGGETQGKGGEFCLEWKYLVQEQSSKSHHHSKLFLCWISSAPFNSLWMCVLRRAQSTIWNAKFMSRTECVEKKCPIISQHFSWTSISVKELQICSHQLSITSLDLQRSTINILC